MTKTNSLSALKLTKKIRKYMESGDINNAELVCDNALPKNKEDPDFLFQVGYVYYVRKRYSEAAEALRKVLQVRPRDPSARLTLWGVYRDAEDFDQMLTLAHEFARAPLSADELLLAFRSYLAVLDWKRAEKIQAQVIELLHHGKMTPTLASAVFIELCTIPSLSSEIVYNIHRNWGDNLVGSVQPFYTSNTPAPSVNERLKIAYVSADFNAHPVGMFMHQLIRLHDKTKFEVYCYAHIEKEDSMTRYFRTHAEHFIDITDLNDGQLAKHIHTDGVHILIDLGGFTSNSRVGSLAYKPAPVQISYLGYPNTTGLPTVDYRITDRFAECDEGTRYVEKLLYMPQSFLCYSAQLAPPPANGAPVERNGFITFGSLNHLRKLTPQTIEAWSRILNRVPGSKFVMKARSVESGGAIILDNILREFASHGIEAERILFLPYVDSHKEHMLQYNEIDIVLDTFPYNGTTTTCDSLIMGAPVVTIIGKTHAQRVSYSILKNIGYEETITDSVDSYVEKAVQLAGQPENLSMLRKVLPALFKHSSLHQPDQFTRQMEDLFLQAWQEKMGEAAFTKAVAATMNDDISIMVPQDLNEITTYVLSEQGDWYEDELRFLRLITKPGMRVLDLSPEYGCFCLSLAKQVGEAGKVLALQSDASKRKLLEESTRLNEFDWLQIESGNNMSAVLQGGIDIIIHPSGGVDSISHKLDIPADSSPVVMLHGIDKGGINTSLIMHMQQLGYIPYRLLPGLNTLIAITEDYSPGSWHQQLFFCKPERADALASEGFLIQQELESIELPDDQSYWINAIEHRPFADGLLPRWIEQVKAQQVSKEWELVQAALCAYAMANQSDTTTEQRYAFLSASLNILLNTEGLLSNTARLSTVVRIASELGNYNAAKQASEMVAEGIKTLQEFTASEPFLPMSKKHDSETVHNNLAEWMLAQALAQAELLINPTSFSSSLEHLTQLNAELSNLGLPNEELKYREKLLAAKNAGEFKSFETLRAPRFSIIIPTRERHDTLQSAIESALNQQEFDDYEIIVMDNLSSEDTYNVVSSFSDDKIKYFRSSERLPMNENWELGFSHSQGEYVFFLGDDDAIMPDALVIADALIRKYQSDIVTWRKAVYWWSNSIVPFQRGRLHASLREKSISLMNSREMLKKYCAHKIVYDDLPGLYNSFVHRKIIDKIKSMHGRYFITQNPDASSAILNAYFSDQYCYTDRALSLSGNSKNSAGSSYMWSHLLNKDQKEKLTQWNAELPQQIEFTQNGCKRTIDYGKFCKEQITDSTMLPVLMARELLVNKEIFFPDDAEINFDPPALLNAMAGSININPHRYEQTLTEIKELAKIHSLSIDFSKIPEKIAFDHAPLQGFNPNSMMISINCAQCGIETAAHAAKALQSIWTDWHAWLAEINR
ncbi:putative O-linked N-acetylglucosamine transferase, SPINDLY family [Mariprofundus ferrinatatus]|uniref:protein O-GlcNAc transferase n=1 Tax=Mariprofundus ferrinatatus TaxID=1921087 RepID=A0A2K8L6K5_9PROT|nr:glycosyltransferase [Mariprofundus ferrinatatus]ATX82965.1 putative O-linked N-acetylglucosamine transferase, SPINDLY family [Mariprofundus ferrinatatus]